MRPTPGLAKAAPPRGPTVPPQGAASNLHRPSSGLAAPAPKVAPAAETAFDRFVAAMTQTALDAGATRLAAELPNVLAEGRLRASMFDGDVTRSLTKAGYLAADGGASVAFVAAAAAWRSVLEGSSSDLKDCGDKTLDEWGAALLAALLGRATSGAEPLRKRLRQDGVAAFGMRDAA